MGIHLVLRPGGSTRGFFWALLASFLALHTFRDSATATTYLGMAGLILGVGVIEATYFMAFRDHLTGLPARRAFNGALLELGSQYTVAMVDVDRFKKFNDQHGHNVGDQVLRLVARELGEVAGGEVGRYAPRIEGLPAAAKPQQKYDCRSSINNQANRNGTQRLYVTSRETAEVFGYAPSCAPERRTAARKAVVDVRNRSESPDW